MFIIVCFYQIKKGILSGYWLPVTVLQPKGVAYSVKCL